MEIEAKVLILTDKENDISVHQYDRVLLPLFVILAAFLLHMCSTKKRARVGETVRETRRDEIRREGLKVGL